MVRTMIGTYKRNQRTHSLIVKCTTQMGKLQSCPPLLQNLHTTEKLQVVTVFCEDLLQNLLNLYKVCTKKAAKTYVQQASTVAAVIFQQRSALYYTCTTTNMVA